MKVKSRKYQLAINNPKAHDMCHDNIKNIVPKIAQVIYWCMSDEIGLETQTYHTHIFIQFQNEVQFSTIKKYFPMAHIEIAKVSPYENRDYIFKLGKWENDPKCHTKIDGTQEEFGTIPQGKSHRRYQRDYERYIEGTSFDHLLISTITPIDIEKFLKSIVSTYNLGGRSLTNIMGYLRSNMVYACKRELLTTNPCLFVELAPIKGFCKTTRQKDSERILSNEDMAKLIATLHQKQSEDELYIQNYAIELATMCGMRVGELSALKWECVEDKVLRIEYSEHRLDFDDKPCEYYIDETKNRKVREFPMTSAMKNLFERIREVQKNMVSQANSYLPIKRGE